MPKVQELARELGMTSQELLSYLERIGRPAPGHTSMVDDEIAERLRSELGNGLVTDSDDARTTTLPRAGEKPAPPPVEFVPASDTDAESAEKKKHSWTRQIAELPVLIFFAFIIAVIIKTFLAQAFFIPSASMLPTLRIGDRVLVEKVGYRFGDEARGDVIVFAKDVLGELPDLPWYQDARNYMRELLGLPTGTEEDYIKRIVAVAGDTIRYAGIPRKLTINGERVAEPYIRDGTDRGSQPLTDRDCKRIGMSSRDGGCVVPAGTVFVMGDNRSNSSDSRAFGPIAESKIVGRAFVVIWPPSDFGGL